MPDSPPEVVELTRLWRERVTPESLGELHEQRLAESGTRKSGGAYYTPLHIVRFIIEHTVIDDDARVLDPACGCGAFLVAAFRHLLARRAPLDVAGRIHVLRRCIFGVDLDERAAAMTRLALLLVALEGSNDPGDHAALLRDTLPALAAENVRVGNSLTTFDWRGETYDAVIGNPPYLNLKRGFLTPDDKAYFESHYTTAAGQYDAFVLFMERALQLTRPGGRHGFILPKPVLTNESYEPIRRLLLDAHTITHVADCGAPFDGAAVEAATIIVRREPAREDSAIELLREWRSSGHVRQASLRDVAGVPLSYLMDDAALAVVTRAMREHPSLGSHCAVFERGIEAGKKALTLRATGPHSRPTLRGDDVTDAGIAAASWWFDATPDTTAVWKRRELYEVPEKLLIRRVANAPIAAVDRDRRWALNTLYVVHPLDGVSCEWLAACLNSAFVRWWFEVRFLSDDRYFPYLRKSQLV
ncbi:MAG: N-6 DNA methylase, partial [Planctomycetota bacterium]